MVTVRITDTATGLDTFTNDADIGSSEPALDGEVDYENNTNSVTFDIPLPYFGVGKVYESSRVAGTPVTYTLTVTNSGHSVGTDVVLGDKFPAGFTFTDSNGTHVSNSVQWAFATLAAQGGTGTGWFSGLLPCTAGTFTNDDYAVIESTEGVTSSVGEPVSFAVQAPTVMAGFQAAPPPSSPARRSPSPTRAPPMAHRSRAGPGASATAARTESDPSHTFESDGIFRTVRLTVADGCAYTDTVTAIITVNAPDLVADFDQSATAVVVGTTVSFIDISTTDGPAIATWAWDFGDGGSSTVRNPTHPFDTVGVYTVELTITDALGYSDSVDATVSVNAPHLVADFDQSATSVVVGSTVFYTDTSTTDGPAITAWAWDFGDGGTSTQRNPSHTFDTIGTFTAQLTVTDALGYSDSVTGTVSVTAACVPLTSADFAFTPAQPIVNSAVTFTATTSPLNATGPITFAWTFGDGSTTTGTDPSVEHAYTTDGSKTVQVTAFNLCTPAGVSARHAVVVAPLPAFEVAKTFTGSRVAGTPVTYTLTVTNTSSTAGTDVVLSDTVPAGVTFADSDGDYAAGAVTWELGGIAPLGGVATGWFRGVLPCSLATVTNAVYGVTSAEGVTQSGTPVALTVKAPALAAAFDPSAATVVGTGITFTDRSTTDGTPIVSWE